MRDAIVIVSASRGGSSFLAEYLRRCQGLNHLRGELNPLLELCGQTYPTSGTGSDLLLPGTETALQEVGAELAYDCGEPRNELTHERDVTRFALDLACRLTMQWPDVEFDLSVVERCLRATLASTEKTLGWPHGRLANPAVFHAIFLSRLREAYPRVDPSYYDLPAEVRRRFVPETQSQHGPPAARLIEEPPFICIEPWRLAATSGLAARPLVIKTPSNAYRLGYLKALFPNARLRILHLTRNPAASINGLCDGWLHGRGFFSHALDVPLVIEGYSDVFPAWGKRWWNFDLPPNWQAMSNLPLEQVCALQWLTSHRAALDYLSQQVSAPSLRLKFENVIRPTTRAQSLRTLQAWLSDLAPVQFPSAQTMDTMPPVMATVPPGAGRWRRRADRLEPLIRQKDVRELAEDLGYGRSSANWD